MVGWEYEWLVAIVMSYSSDQSQGEINKENTTFSLV